MVDRLIALVCCLLLIPVFLLIGLLIYLEDGSPIFFKQCRVGQDYTFFWIYKFRTMRKGTPNVATHLLQDPEAYLLKVGRFLRKLSLDELPNLWNIVRGEMGFIGPRPALYNQDDLMALRVAAGVHRLLPGITGWAQVNGRDALSLEEKVRFEAEYLRRKSLAFHAKILYLTAAAVLVSKGVRH